MQNIPSRRFRGGIPVLVTVLLAFSATALSAFFPAGAARAASLAEEHTVLYYLVEMQRRFKKNCGGEPMPEAPSLNPSTALRTLAMQSATSDQPLDVFANAGGLAGIPFLGAKIPSQNAQDAFERLNAAQCVNLMNPAYRYIGAAHSGDEWILFMAGAEPAIMPEDSSAMGAPVTVVSNPGETAPDPAAAQSPVRSEPVPQAAKPISPSVSTQPALRENRPQPVPSASGGTGRANDPGPASSVPVTGGPAGGAGALSSQPGPVDAPAAPGTQASPAPAGAVAPPALSAGGEQTAAPPADASRTKDDPSPAPNVPVAEIPVDGTGRAIGGPKPLGSAGPSGPAYLPAPGKAPVAPIYVPPGGAGPVKDPAAPVVVRELEAGPTGNISGPAQPGHPAPSGGAAPVLRPLTPPSVPPGQNAPPRQGVVPLHEQGAPVHPGGQGLLFPGPSGAARDAGPTGAARDAGPTGAASDAGMSAMGPAPAESGQLLRLVNQNRALGRYCGTARMPAAAPLKSNPTIAAVAQAQADAMAAGGYFSSTSPQGVTLGQRVSASGYTWAFVAENIARVPPPVDNAVQSWMANQGQCANLMSADYVDVGIGHNALNNIWVLTLAAPMPDGALKVQ